MALSKVNVTKMLFHMKELLYLHERCSKEFSSSCFCIPNICSPCQLPNVIVLAPQCYCYDYSCYHCYCCFLLAFVIIVLLSQYLLTPAYQRAVIVLISQCYCYDYYQNRFYCYCFALVSQYLAFLSAAADQRYVIFLCCYLFCFLLLFCFVFCCFVIVLFWFPNICPPCQQLQIKGMLFSCFDFSFLLLFWFVLFCYCFVLVSQYLLSLSAAADQRYVIFCVVLCFVFFCYFFLFSFVLLLSCFGFPIFAVPVSSCRSNVCYFLELLFVLFSFVILFCVVLLLFCFGFPIFALPVSSCRSKGCYFRSK